MPKKLVYTKEQKYEILKEIELSDLFIEDTCRKYNISYNTYTNWRFLYTKYGMESLKENRTWKTYPKYLKEMAVLEYLNGEDSLITICRKHEISSSSVLRGWIKRYNAHNEFKTTKGRGNTVMTKGRKTNLKERMEITKYCIKQNKDYHQTSEIYKVSYQQVYQWTRKYEELGEKGLYDGRGKTKLEICGDDKIKIEMRKLRRDNDRLEMENDFLKKLQDLERRGC